MAEKDKGILQWHPAFYAGIQIELAEEADKLIFENEHQLGTKPKEIDVLIIKKSSEEEIHKNIGRIFRTHNVVEYKSPEDYLSIDDYYKVCGYACFYKSDVKQVNSIKAEDITISFVCKSYPRKMMTHLQRVRHLKVEKQEKGIYYIHGDIFPMQLILTSKLSKEMNFWLGNLTNDLKEVKDAQALVREYGKYEKSKLHQAVMDIIVRANGKIFKEDEKVCEALMEIMRDKMQEELEERKKQGINEGRLEGISLGKLETYLEMIQDGFISVAEAARRLQMSEKELLEKMKA